MARTEVVPAAEAGPSSDAVRIERVEVDAYTVPTDLPESDGTLQWSATTMVLVRIFAGGKCGLGFSYADRSCAILAHDLLAPLITGGDAWAIASLWQEMLRVIRNLGRSGIASMAIAAIDNALWDLKARLLDLPLAVLLGAARERVPVYGSGGFTSYSDAQLSEQLGGWACAGIGRVKMKVGREPARDVVRVKAARDAIGPNVELFVDANGAYGRKQALALADSFARLGVAWYEEPVSSDDLEGLRLIRDHAPPGMEVAAGEYGYDQAYFRRMLAAGAVDVLQADATRCAGISGFMRAAALCEAFGLPLSSHCAPSMHLHAALAVPCLRHMEYFHDHVRIEHLLFDGVATPRHGLLQADLSRPGMGLEFKCADARRYQV